MPFVLAKSLFNLSCIFTVGGPARRLSSVNRPPKRSAEQIQYIKSFDVLEVLYPADGVSVLQLSESFALKGP